MISNPWREMPVHRIFVLTEHGLAPPLLNQFLNRTAHEYGCRVILDPFIGSGTVAVEALKHGYRVIGIDSNPWMLIVTLAKTTKIKETRIKLSDIKRLFNETNQPLIPSERLEKYHTRSQLRMLGKLRAVAEKLNHNIYPLAITVFGTIAYRYSRLKRTPAPEFREKTRRPIKRVIIREYFDMLRVAVKDLASTQYLGDIQLIQADSTQWLPSRIECLITSPPFANNVDYIRHTMLYLLWANLARDSNDLGRLRDIQAPSCEAAARSWREETKDPEVHALAERIQGSRRKGYRRFLLQYFHAMERHLELLAEGLEGTAWYTIGDSVLGGVYIPVHKILARIAEKHGLKTAIEVIGERYRRDRYLYLLKIEKPY